jgi:hypothetical protein
MMDYRSPATLLGLPLVHISMSRIVDGRFRRGIATGWVAIGDVAFGVLFAAGGVSVGTLSLGGVALGAVPVGGLALGALALGGCAVGVVALGGMAVAWHAAVGGVAVAKDFAAGGVAIAQRVIEPIPGGRLPFSAIPHAPFHWTDAVWLALILWLLLRVTWAVQRRRAR